MVIPNKNEFTIPVTVEFEDVDTFQIAHHTKLVAYLERARLRFLYHLGLDIDGGEHGVVMYRLQMRFSQPARLMDSLSVSVFVKSVEEFQLYLGYTIRKDKKLVARATTSIAFIDIKTQKLIPVPDGLTDAVAKHQDS